ISSRRVKFFSTREGSWLHSDIAGVLGTSRIWNQSSTSTEKTQVGMVARRSPRYITFRCRAQVRRAPDEVRQPPGSDLETRTQFGTSSRIGALPADSRLHLTLPCRSNSLKCTYTSRALHTMHNRFSATVYLRLPRRFLSSLLILAVLSPAFAGDMVRPSHGSKAMVATMHPEASKVGVAILRQGGNAVDAAVAVGFALQVVLPEAGNIGGGGFMLFRRPDGEVHFLDYREKAPAKAEADMYLDSHGNVIPDMSTIGYKAIGVPGSVAGL